MAIVNQLLTEKLRPKKMEHIILSKRIRQSIGDGDLSQNYLLSGSPGIGKTTMAKILAKDRPTLYLNISESRGIDTIRSSIMDFASTRSTIKTEKTDFKVIILDEFDGATTDFQNALRATMEKFHSNVRFIATCNYLNKIPEPIQSRFLVIKFDPQDSDEELEMMELYKKRISTVTEKLGIKWESDEVMDEFLKKNFPDLRRIFSKIQDFDVSNIKEITLDDVKRSVFTFKELYEMIVSKPDPHKNYKLILTEYSNKIDEVFISLNLEFPDWLIENKPKLESKLPEILISIPDWEFKKNSLIDPVTALLACIFDLQKICN